MPVFPKTTRMGDLFARRVALGFDDFSNHLAFQPRQAVEENNAFQMIHLVLNAGCQQAVALNSCALPS